MLEFKDLNMWGKRLAILVAVLVGFLSWYGGRTPFWIAVRTGVAFLFIYLLCVGLLVLFEKCAPPTQKPSVQQTRQDSSDLSEEPGEQKNVDGVSVELSMESRKGAGQVKANLAENLTDPENQAEIVRRMGWGDRR